MRQEATLSVSSSRQPLPFVKANAADMAGIKEVRVCSTSYLATDRFSLCAALTGAGYSEWSASPLVVEIGISLDGERISLITGNADIVSVDPLSGEVRLSGRDFAADFISSQIEESFENQTSSEIALTLAQKHGLEPHVTTTQTPVGRYYQNSRTRVALTQHARATTEWDLICWLAQLEGFEVWVKGSDFFFQPLDRLTPSLVLGPQDCMSMALHHSLDIAAGVAFTVKSWDVTNQAAVTQTVSSGPRSSGQMNRTVVRPNLSNSEAQRLALQLFNQTTAHERRVEMEMPGEFLAQPRSTLLLQDTKTDFDGFYAISSVERRLSFKHGFTQTIEAKSFPWIPS